MAGEENNKNCFTFMWMLENVSYCLQKKGEVIQSPAFLVDEIPETKWMLWLYPRGETDGHYISCFLLRELDLEGEESVEIKFKLAIIGESGLALTSSASSRHSFSSREQGYGCPKFEKREEVFISKRSTYLPKDTLKIRCRIWKSFGCMEQKIQCFARTRIGVEKRTFDWEISDFSTYQPEKTSTYLIKSLQDDSELMSANLSLTGGQNCGEIFHFKLIRRDENIKYCTLRLSILDEKEEYVECHQDEFWFDGVDNNKYFTYMISRQMLMVKKLLSDILSMRWEFVFSKGVVWEEIEEVKCEYSRSFE